MIDKKPFRVTNEQIFADTMCGMYCNDCDLALSKPDAWNCPKGNAKVFDYAHDLHDARELIDKQTEMIKEMREEIGSVVAQESTTATKGELVYISNFTEMRDILEKTKDYAL